MSPTERSIQKGAKASRHRYFDQHGHWPEDAKRHKHVRIPVTVTGAELDTLREAAAAADLTVSAYIRGRLGL